jgi:hypothetical protein
MTFFSRHPDAPILYNDVMRNAYREGLYRAMTKGTLLEAADELVDVQPREVDGLKELVWDLLHERGARPRLRLWREIVALHFMEYSSSNYLQAVRLLLEEHRIGFVDVKGTGRLNDDSVLYIKKRGAGSPSIRVEAA